MNDRSMMGMNSWKALIPRQPLRPVPSPLSKFVTCVHSSVITAGSNTESEVDKGPLPLSMD